MIASPGDVAEEREIIRSVIHDWNDVNATVSKIVLTPVGWDTHSSPELGTRAQDLINSHLLKACDLLVGVFWTRLAERNRGQGALFRGSEKCTRTPVSLLPFWRIF